ncbi:MAG TPA: hypothetical protein VMJ10_37805 [Kofleriaceae bacterium]|nr:hypothetical protein [Kofleriaceae bacterium]
MKHVARFAAAALAIATVVASAQPPSSPLDRDRHTDERVPEQGDREYSGWVPLADHFSAVGEHQLVTVGASAGRFRRLRLEGERGRPFLRAMLVRFVDGSSQDIRLDRVLRPGESAVYELDGGSREIAQIVVKTQPDSKSAYSIMAEK